MNREADFTKRTKTILAARAGYRCSYPGCPATTIGPGLSPNETESTGAVCHIYSASSGGPRGPGGLSRAQRALPENGIWLCVTHAKLVDNNRGDRYPPARLRRYRYQHEARIAMEQGHRPFGWIRDLTIHESSVFEADSRLSLGKVVLLSGENGQGKTFIFRLLDTLSHEARYSLGRIGLEDEPLHYSVRLWSPEPHEFRVRWDGASLQAALDGAEVLFNPLAVDVYFQQKETRYVPLEQYLKRTREAAKREYEDYDDVALLSEYFQIDEPLLLTLFPRVGEIVPHLVDSVRPTGRRGSRRVLVNDKKWKPGASIHEISGGMLQMMALDITISRAEVLAQQMPVLLLLNHPHLQLDDRHMAKYSAYLHGENVLFQTVIESPFPDWRSAADIAWQRTLLTGPTGRVRIQELE